MSLIMFSQFQELQRWHCVVALSAGLALTTINKHPLHLANIRRFGCAAAS
ncbi:hypothetical protein ACLSSQ_03795 [Azospira sp. APE16]